MKYKSNRSEGGCPGKILFFVLFTSLFCNAVSQPYEHSGGIRAGYSSGLSYKGFFRYSLGAVEGDLLYNRNGFNVTILYELHYEAFRTKRVLLYGGGGLFGGNWEEHPSAGISPVAGIEFIVRDLPVNFSIDWKPMINVYRYFHYDVADVGISIRYRFQF